MPILGLIDSATFANAVGVTINSPTVTKNAADEIAAGDIIVLGGVRYFVKAVVSDTEITLGSNYAAATNAALAGAQRRTAPKALADYIIRGGDSAAGDVQIIGVSRAEAQLADNKSRGISSPGWWAYRTYTDAAGSTRHKSECIASFKDGSQLSGDFSDDAVAADRAIVISVQPASQEVSTGAPATFAVTAAIEGAAGGSITAQWQVSTDGGANFTPVSNGLPTGFGGTYLYQGTGFSGQELRITATAAQMANYQYRVTLSTTQDSGDVTSEAATLTFS